ncbi:uncharacterized protein TNCV_1573231 [Trichonephila clavipes]|uniref:Uncharacterized protein n=1 Tax=Trichonephila clavipes TaxID=2585209 RepID=A0A8X6SKP1_TRICX|nr:uncharacterized protein TNCV_1573231 [Trichonephila clavipes]
MDYVILNHGQMAWTTPEVAPSLLTATPHQREDISALDRFNMHRCPTRRVLSGTGLELMTCLQSSNTLTTRLPWPSSLVEAMKTGKTPLVLESFPYAFFSNSSASEGDFSSETQNLMFARCSEDDIVKPNE